MQRVLGIVVGVVGLCSLGWADAVDDLRNGTDLDFDLKGMTYVYTGAQSGNGTVTDEQAPPGCIAKTAGTLNFVLSTANLGLPFSITVNMVGSKVSPTRAKWTTDTSPNQCISIDINGTPTNVLIKRIRGQLTSNAATFDPFFDSICNRGYNCGLDDTASDTDTWMDVEAYALCIQSIFTRIDFRARTFDFVGYAGLPVGTVHATSYTVVDGFEFSGALPDLRTSDDSYLVVYNGDDLGAVVDFGTSAPQTGLGKVQFEFEGAASRPGLSIGLSLYNFGSGSYQVLSGSPAPITDTARVVGVISGGAVYIDPATRAMIGRVEWHPINDEDPSQDGWAHQIDVARWSVGP